MLPLTFLSEFSRIRGQMWNKRPIGSLQLRVLIGLKINLKSEEPAR